MRVAGASVVITGAGSGIGRALAIEFAANGAKVVCTGRRIDRLKETVDLIKNDGGMALAVIADVAEPEQVKSLLRRTVEAFERVDVLFNNAGRFKSIAGVHEVDPEDWWEDVKVNLFGPLLLIRQILPLMIQRNRGVIINMDGGRPVGGTGYACGKAGLMQLNEILAKELKMLESDVIVLGAGPGLVRTEMTELQANTEAGRKWIPSTKECLVSGNVRKPEEIAKATIKALLCVKPEHSGQSFGPDFSGFQP